MPSPEPSPLESLDSRLRAFRAAFHRLEVDCPPPVAAPPASEAQVSAVEAALGFGIPASLRAVLLARAARFAFRFSLRRVPPKGWKGLFRKKKNLSPWVELPPELEGIFSGACCWDLDALPALESTRQVWAERVFTHPERPAHRLWRGKLAFQEAPTGDLLALDLEAPGSPVVYLSQEGGALHGAVLGASFTDFIDRWSQVGFAGPEDFQIERFYTPGAGIDPRGPSALAWRAFLGME